jgi:hypothetical protein
MARVPKKYKYHIILANHGKMQKDLYWTDTPTNVYKKFHDMIEENKNVVFPINYNNEKTKIVESEYELIIIKSKDKEDESVSRIRDEYGKYIIYESSDNDWIIYDRSPYYIEETFWVYGYHPKLQRKDFAWILDNIVAKDIKNKYMCKSIQIFKNKILVDCNGKLDMIICKNHSDAVRFYNKVENIAEERKYKYLIFLYDVTYSKYKKIWVQRIKDLTHWDNKKILRSSTRP